MAEGIKGSQLEDLAALSEGAVPKIDGDGNFAVSKIVDSLTEFVIESSAPVLIGDADSGGNRMVCRVDDNGDEASLGHRHPVNGYGTGLHVVGMVTTVGDKDGLVSTAKIVVSGAAETIKATAPNGYHFQGGTAVIPELPATPTAQDVVDALVDLGLVTQAAP